MGLPILLLSPGKAKPLLGKGLQKVFKIYSRAALKQVPVDDLGKSIVP